MTVYALLEHTRYEGDALLDIYSDLDTANAEAKHLNESQAQEDTHYQVAPFLVK